MLVVLGKIDWTGWVVPISCIAGPGTVNALLIKGLAPFALICMMPALGALLDGLYCRGNSKDRASMGASVTRGACAWLPYSLFTAFCFTPSVSMSAFSAWNCVGFAVDDTAEQFFLEHDLAVSCDGSKAYKTVLLVSWLLIAIWPVGMVLMYSALLIPCRGLLYHEEVNSAHLSATAFLHRDYKKEL